MLPWPGAGGKEPRLPRGAVGSGGRGSQHLFYGPKMRLTDAVAAIRKQWQHLMENDKEKKMTTSAHNIPIVIESPTTIMDDDGFLDLSHMRGDYAYLQELLRQRKLLDEA